MPTACRQTGTPSSGFPDQLRYYLAGAMVLILLFSSGCGDRTIQISLVPTHGGIHPRLVHKSRHWFVSNRVAIINISGMLLDGSDGLLGGGHNPVSDLKQTLDHIAHDPRVKAVILRMNTPGGTVTASTMMYHEILAFKKRTRMPVIASMMDLCASGGYYVSCAADYQMAYPTTITGSIGVIVQLFNFHRALHYLGIQAPVFVSGPNKDTGSPFHAMTPENRKLIQGFVTQFYARFVRIVKTTHPDVNPADWPKLADGRPLTGQDAFHDHLINGLGGLEAAIKLAKKMAHIRHANVVLYRRYSQASGSIYARSHIPEPRGQQFNLMNLNLNGADMTTLLHPNFFYLWP
ncbi:MAG: signal peptide peptidase SppA [Planctomycetia bacterium]|nr:signal peptide peptidase SppA [Planctomycetia bacterium]